MCSQCWNVPYFVGTPKPAKQYEADFDTGNFHRLYEEFISILALNTSPLVQITMEQFSKLYFFVCLDLTGCPSCNSSHKHVASEARVNISAEVTGYSWLPIQYRTKLFWWTNIVIYQSITEEKHSLNTKMKCLAWAIVTWKCFAEHWQENHFLGWPLVTCYLP